MINKPEHCNFYLYRAWQCMTGTTRHQQHPDSTSGIQTFQCTSHIFKKRSGDNGNIWGSSRRWYLLSILVKRMFMRNTWSREFRQQLWPRLYSPTAAAGEKKGKWGLGIGTGKKSENDLKVANSSWARSGIRCISPASWSKKSILLFNLLFCLIYSSVSQADNIHFCLASDRKKIQVNLANDAQISPSSSIFSPLVTHLNIKYNNRRQRMSAWGE